MTLDNQEVRNIRIHTGIKTGYRRIEMDAKQELVGARRAGEPLRRLPAWDREIRAAGAVFDYIASPLLHDLNRMTLMLNVWEEQLPAAPNKALKALVEGMEQWILEHGGRP